MAPEPFGVGGASDTLAGNALTASTGGTGDALAGNTLAAGTGGTGDGYRELGSGRQLPGVCAHSNKGVMKNAT
ncbi:unnamed protein product [Ilex paraguariensis]|uniref:Uncharacterized protein n=1 Tax=Ilex paraguariensis TaxID=185542 RepID=A0ABC8UTA9_9AQUA